MMSNSEYVLGWRECTHLACELIKFREGSEVASNLRAILIGNLNAPVPQTAAPQAPAEEADTTLTCEELAMQAQIYPKVFERKPADSTKEAAQTEQNPSQFKDCI